MSTAKRMSNNRFKDRIKEFRRVKASDLTRNEKNWRTHTEDQRGAVTSMLDEVGYVSTLIAWEPEDGKLMLIDGHLRADISDDEEVPVVIVDVTEEEADKILLTFDPLAELAGFDNSALEDLLTSIGEELDHDAHLRKLLTDLHTQLEKEEKKEKRSNKEQEVEGMPLDPHEHYDYLVILATTTHDWNVLCERLRLVPEKRRGRMATARAIRAEHLMKYLKSMEEVEAMEKQAHA